jgi:hypothetical protein
MRHVAKSIQTVSLLNLLQKSRFIQRGPIHCLRRGEALSPHPRRAPVIAGPEGNLGMHQQVAYRADFSDREPVLGLSAAPAAAEGAIEPGSIISLPRVWARIPDLDAVEAAAALEPPPASSDGRLISQSLSTKLLLGGTFLLLLAAIVPWSIRKSGNAAPAVEENVPTWSPSPTSSAADKAQNPGGQAAQTSKAPSGGPNAAPPPAGPAAPQLSGTTRAPSSQYEVSRPSPGYYRQHPAEASSNQPMVIGEPARTAPSGEGAAEPGTPRADPGSAGQPDARRDFPRDNGPYRQGQDRDRYPVGLADRRMTVPPPNPSGAASLPPGEPGVARFEGTIENPPPIKSAYEPARPGVH